MSQNNPSYQGRVVSFTPLTLLSLGAITVGTILLIIYYPRLPGQIPIHFNGQGEADGFGAKSWLILLPIVSLAIWYPVFWLQKRPHLLNYSVRITPENTERQYALASQFLGWMNFIVSLLFLSVIWMTIQAASSGSNQISSWIIPVFLTAIGGALIIYLINASSRSSRKVVRRKKQ